MCSRFIMYKDFINAHSEYDKFFVTDIRDVIFQGDIFASYEGNFLAYSTTKYTIQTSAYDSQWVRNIFSEEDYQQIKDNRVICAGMIFGTRAEMIIVLTKMIEFFQRETVWGDDQAVLNYLIYAKQLPIENIVTSEVETGSFINLGVIGTPHVGFVNGDKILREDGGIPAVVHQWTGYDYGINFVNEFYRAKEFQPDEKFTDTRCALEQVFCLAQVKNWDAATKFFMKYVFGADNLNIYAEKFVKLWTNILDIYAPQHFDAELLIMTLKKIIVSTFGPTVNIKQLDNFYSLYVRTKNFALPINTSFKIWMVMYLRQFAVIFHQNKMFDPALICIARIFEIGLPIGADVYLLQAEIYRAAGKKAEALAAYEKAIDAT